MHDTLYDKGKSRYSSVSLFLGQEEASLRHLNDLSADIDEESRRLLLQGGVDPPMADHVAHLFTRDPLVIFNDSIFLDDNKSMVYLSIYLSVCLSVY